MSIIEGKSNSMDIDSAVVPWNTNSNSTLTCSMLRVQKVLAVTKTSYHVWYGRFISMSLSLTVCFADRPELSTGILVDGRFSWFPILLKELTDKEIVITIGLCQLHMLIGVVVYRNYESFVFEAVPVILWIR